MSQGDIALTSSVCRLDDAVRRAIESHVARIIIPVPRHLEKNNQIKNSSTNTR